MELTERKPKLDPLATPDEGPHVKRVHIDKRVNYDSREARNNGPFNRTAFQRDRERILYSKAFRRLIHKTQVCFTGEMNEHIRTRLTHTLEVSQIARGIARQVHANEDLVEAIALGHDVGHTPFGHMGETVLNDFLSGRDEGIKKKFQEMYKFDITEMKLCFKHNFQSVRVLNELEEGYNFKGLNLTTPVLEGILKHTKLKSNGCSIFYEGINDNEAFHMEQKFSCSLEGQIVALADEIVQVCHDIEDAIEGNYDSKEIICDKLQNLINDEEINISCLENDVKNVKVTKIISDHQFKFLISCIINQIISYAVTKINENMQKLNKELNEDPKYTLNKEIATDYVPENCKLYDKLKEIENIKNPKYVLNKEIATDCVLEDCKLYNKLREIEEIYVINNYMINKMNGKSIFVLRQVIKAYLTNPKQLPDHVLELYAKDCSVPTLKELIKHIDSTPKNIRYINKDVFEDNKGHIIRDRAFLLLVSDYIASMTDRYALQEYQKLYGGNSI